MPITELDIQTYIEREGIDLQTGRLSISATPIYVYVNGVLFRIIKREIDVMPLHSQVLEDDLSPIGKGLSNALR